MIDTPQQPPTAPRVPAISPRKYRPVEAYIAPVSGSVEDRLARLAEAINRKADKDTVPNFVAITLLGQDNKSYIVYVDSAGTLRCEPVT